MTALSAAAQEVAMAAGLAARRIRPYVRETPTAEALDLAALVDGPVQLKLENWQHTGSFKLRGAMNKLLLLSAAERKRGVVAASSGNHGAAVAYGCRALGAPAIVFVPEHAAATKLAAMRRLGVDVRLAGDDSLVSEVTARAYAAEQGLAYISPYNDLDVVAGQGTVGVELLAQAPQCDTLYVAVGGGGLIGGVAAVVKQARPQVRVVGCLPQNSPVMAVSVQRGAIVDMESLPTLSDGTAGGIEPGAVTFDLCRELVDDYVLVSEQQIAEAMRLVLEGQHMLVEGAAGVAVAGLLHDGGRRSGQRPGQHSAVVLCGANISLPTLKSIL